GDAATPPPDLAFRSRPRTGREAGPGGAAMNVNAPISLVVAAYRDLDAAAADFTTVWSARADGSFHHTSIALLNRDVDDTLQVELSDSTAKYLHWGGALMGGPVFLLAPSTGAKLLSAGG